MPLVLIVLAVSTAVGLLLGGSLRAWGRMRLHWWALAPLGVALQAIPIPGSWEYQETVGAATLVSSYVVLLAFVLVNRRVPGAALMAAGLVLNLAVVTPNGGMPVSTDAIRQAAGDGVEDVRYPQDEAKHHLMSDDDVLRPLGDVVPVPPPFRLVLSVGDVILYAGIAWFVVIVTRGRFRENLRPPARRFQMYRGKHAPAAYRLPGRYRKSRGAAPAGAATSRTGP
jgi:uncharacterized protein DUF5317